MAATIVGFVGVAGLIALAVWVQSPWFAILSVFILMNCWTGLRQALALSRRDKMPRRAGFACPSCKAAPFIGPYWQCGKCGNAFDTFETHAVCPHCGSQFTATSCLDCGKAHSMNDWAALILAPPL